MSLWSRTSAPKWVPNAVVGQQGWVHPVTNETLVTFDTKGGATITLTSVTGTFTVGETITGGTSGATGIVTVYNISGITKTLHLKNITGTFQTAETCTGGSSSAHGTSATVVVGPAIPATPAIQSVTFYKSYLANGNAVTNPKTSFVSTQRWRFAVRFNGQVTVVGAPYITVTIQGISRHAAYVHGSGTATLLFEYQLVIGDYAGPGGVVVSSPVQLNSGHIYKLGTTTAATITFTPPTMSSVTVTSTSATVNTATGITNGHHYVSSNAISLTLTYDESVTVTGSPSIAVNISATVRQMVYASGSGTAALVFTYSPVVSGDVCTAGQFSVASTVVLNSGTINDSTGTPAILTYTPPTTSTVFVN